MTTTTATWNEAAPRRADNVEIAPRISEDWLSLIIGLFIFVLALAGIANVDLPRKKLIGWSLGIGVVLLIILAIVNHLFPASI